MNEASSVSIHEHIRGSPLPVRGRNPTPLKNLIEKIHSFQRGVDFYLPFSKFSKIFLKNTLLAKNSTLLAKTAQKFFAAHSAGALLFFSPIYVPV
jgi:hypothetical protein